MLRRPAFLALGSNLGRREATLASALGALESLGFRTGARSSLYLTEPVGGPPQDWYVNAVVEGETQLGPRELLAACLDAERTLGRARGVRNGPRTIDIDILFYADVVQDEPGLTLPHPRLHERRFVLVPLSEIAPELRHPLLGVTIRELLARCPDPSRVVLHQKAAS